MDAALFSINLAHADPEEEVRDGDEVGLFPPVSGG
jgi:molybdopterin converting factor small subunit